MGKKILSFLACFLMTASMAFAQKQATGTVFDSDTGEPMVGVAVKVKGTNIGMLTDINGKFVLRNIPDKVQTLDFTIVGMQPLTVKIQNNMKVYMSSAISDLDEVMVVAYGTAKKSAFTGSAGVVKKEQIEARVTSNVSNALSGQVAGVQTVSSSGAPGSGSSIRIRGIGSMSASSDPLYIVDGAPYEGAISAINPQDIESITVLKDAAANAIYGARGANGVVQITTKKGTTSDAKITLEAKWGSNSRAIPTYSHLGTEAYVETAYQALYNSKLFSGATADAAHAFAEANIWNSNNGGLGTQIYTVPEGEYLVGYNGKLNPNAKLGYSDGKYYYTPDNWYDELFKHSLRQEYNVSVSGRSDKLNYYASAGYLDDSGIVQNSGFTRYSGRSKVDYQAKDWLRIGTNMAFSQNTSSEAGGSGSDYDGSVINLFSIANNMAPVYPLYVRDKDGNIMYESATGTPLYDNGATSTNMKRPFMGNSRVGAVYANDRGKTVSTTFNGNWYATITPIEGLNLTADLSQMEYNARWNYLSSVFGSSSVTEQGNASAQHTRRSTTNARYMATYNHVFDNKHTLDVLAGYESFRRKSQVISASNDHLYNPFVGEVNNAHGIAGKDAGSYTDNYMTEGIMARVQYDYMQKYFASASYRRDASSYFHPDNRWGNFGSVGLGWLMNKENFMEGTKNWLDELKLKVSWGVQGNDDLDNYYPYMDQYSISYSEETGEFSKVLSYKGNKDLTWEHNQEWNVGMEFSVFKGRLDGSLEYFNRKTSDLLYNKDVPMTAGNPLGYYPTNIGSMRNSGIELNLNTYFIKRKDIEWSFNLNLTHYKNKILELDESIDPLQGWVYGSTIRRVGGSLYNSFLPRYAGVDPETGEALYYKNPDGRGYKTDEKGNFLLDKNGNKIPNDPDWTKTTYEDAQESDLGCTLAKVYGGLGSNFRYKGLDISFQLAYQLGGRTYDTNYQRMMHSGFSSRMGSTWHKDILKAWTPTNTDTDVPRVCALDDTYQNPSDRFMVSSNYLSINNVTIGYTLPKVWTRKATIESVRVFVTGDNLAVISCRRGWDPRYSLGSGTSNKASSSNYTAMRNITAGVKVQF